jgi:hypothetical protein
MTVFSENVKMLKFKGRNLLKSWKILGLKFSLNLPTTMHINNNINTHSNRSFLTLHSSSHHRRTRT